MRSSAAWLEASWPRTAVAISPLTFSTALRHALAHPRPSRRRAARWPRTRRSRRPRARRRGPTAPERTLSSTSTVGLPRLSRIWRACTCSIWLIGGGALLRSGALGRSRRAAHRGRDRSSSWPSDAASSLPATTRAWNRSAAARSASSGSTRQLARHVDRREQHVAELVEALARAPAPPRARRARRARDWSGPSTPGKSNPLDAARRCTLRAYSGAGRFSGTSPKTPPLAARLAAA